MPESRKQLVGQIREPGRRPQNVDIVVKEKPQLTEDELNAGLEWVDGRYEVGDVRRYGATGDGVTDDSTAIQNAADSNSRVYFPAGDYICDSIITINSDNTFYGDGIAATRLIKNADNNASEGLINCNSGSSSSFISNLTIRDMELDGLVATDSFSEFRHLVALNGVDNVLIEGVKFSGWRGDGIYLGSQSGERHNKNVTIRGCIFDGVNNDNRNAISVIDVDGLIIEGNHFYDCTRSNMPGAIDLEPNNNAYHICRNVTIANNTFKDCGGNVANISLVFNQATFTNQPENFSVTGNVFDGTSRAFAVLSNATGYTRPLNITFSGNAGSVSDFITAGDFVQGLNYTDNTLYGTGQFFLTFDATDEAQDIVISGNVFYGDGSTTEGIRLRSGNNVIISDNVFNDLQDYVVFIGGTGATIDNVIVKDNSTVSCQAGIEFNGGTITNIAIEDNDLRGCTTAIEGTIPSDTRIRGNLGYVSENGGSASVATGGTVSHGCAQTPNVVQVTALSSSVTDVYVTSIGSTTFAINFGGGGTQDFAWEAKIAEHYNE